MLNKGIRIFFVIFPLLIIGVVSLSCSTSSTLIGRWQDTNQKNGYIEFLKDGRLILDDGNNIITGNYEIMSNNYIKISFDGFTGAFVRLFSGDTARFQISGNTLTLQYGGQSSTYKRSR